MISLIVKSPLSLLVAKTSNINAALDLYDAGYTVFGLDILKHQKRKWLPILITFSVSMSFYKLLQ